jgi:hypothetical protein
MNKGNADDGFVSQAQLSASQGHETMSHIPKPPKLSTGAYLGLAESGLPAEFADTTGARGLDC